MNISKIEENLQNVLSNFTPKTFIYDLLSAYGKPKASITRLQKCNYNSSKNDGEVLWKKNLFFKEVNKRDLYSAFEEISQRKKTIKHSPRFLIVSDYQTVLALDTITDDKLDIPISALAENFDFFLPLAGHEKITHHKENAADIKAAERMAKIYDEICKNNPGIENEIHGLNVFLSRLLFCFFAESTHIFKQNIFINTIDTRTKEDGSDLHQYFNALFELLNTSEKEKLGYPKYLEVFPYVNGGLFKDKYNTPHFSHKSRKMIIDCGKMDWSVINPDIFGSMIQAVVHPDQRSNLGMHYTSVANIMKVIKPLFLDELYQNFEKNKDNKKKLEELYKRLANIKIFDPACGSGNFLIIAYKELRKLEIQILEQLEKLGKHPTFLSQIKLSNFYGIEIDGFACEIAKLSLWLAEHQMNIEFKNVFGVAGPSLPLKEGGHIVCGNATRLDWDKVCPKDSKSKTYLLGNPPYLGTRNQSACHKEDMAHVFQSFSKYKNLDYISCWFLNGVNYIKESNSCLAFVSTNSITQGDQVDLLWPYLLEKKVEIGFCYQSFKWTNHARKKAGVSCVIIGLRNIVNEQKLIFNESLVNIVDTINPYLTPGNRKTLSRRAEPISCLPAMLYGNEPRENGHLILEIDEKRKILCEYPHAKKFMKKVTGSNEFINGIERWCLWITDSNFVEANIIPPIKHRLQKVIEYRNANSRKDTIKFADKPYRFTSITYRDCQSILVPIVSSDLREYIPCGFLNGNYVILNSAQVIYNAEPYIFGIISSKLHLSWVKATAGKLETRIRYSSLICYNNFPVPNLNKKQKESIRIHALNILSEREKHPEKTIAELYDPKKMPEGLREAHRNLDVTVESCYQTKSFESDEERLDCLFKLYEEMTKNEQVRK